MAESATPPEPISPEQARLALDRAMAERLGPDWQDEGSGWLLVTGNDYMARVTRGSFNLDFMVDLLGNVTIEEKPLSPAQTSGRLIAWTLLLLALGIVYLIARALGWL
ncbi:MAG: hypothetical protein JNL34_06560 [Anaerolineae bacterium]|nr:hypothetical protein [Anaerolineae bacterium]